MNDDRRNDDLLPPGEDAARALEALSRLPGAKGPADPRERARRAFLTGRVDASGGGVAPAGRPAMARWARLLMAATLGVLALVWFGLQPTEEWLVLDVVAPEGVVAGPGPVVATGVYLPGGTVATGPQSEIELQLGGRLRIRVLPGSSLELPRGPGRWFGRDRHLALESGEIYGTSGGTQLGFGLVFGTDELDARLTGTTFAVFRTDDASCVCLWSGGIAVDPLVGLRETVVLAPEQRVWVYKDGRAPELLPLSDMETMKLQMIDAAGLAGVGAGGR